MAEFTFEDLSKKTVAQLRKIAEETEHEALQDVAKMPKADLLAALCQALGVEAVEAGEAPDSSEKKEEAKEEEPPAEESQPAEASEEKVEEEEPPAPESEASEAAEPPPKESAKEEEAAPAQEEDSPEPAAEAAADDAEEEKPAAEEGATDEKAAAEEAAPKDTSPVVNERKTKLKGQIRELKSQRDAALEAHDHVQLKAIRRRIRSLKRQVRRMAV